MYLEPSERGVRTRGWLRALTILAGSIGTLAATGLASAGPTDYQQTMPLVWALTALSVVGSALTFAVLIWALLRFRDPATKGRRYG
jgi:hypothetical protein